MEVIREGKIWIEICLREYMPQKIAFGFQNYKA